MSGLLALPLIALLIHSLCPEWSVVWKIVGPLPLAVYVVLLAQEDKEWGRISNFTTKLVYGIGVIYVGWIILYFVL